jgi:hypothetical protein
VTASSAPAPSPEIEQALWSDFLALCSFGGRVAGSSSETAAVAWLRRRLAEVPGGALRLDIVDYAAWRCERAELVDAASGASFGCTPLACTPLLGSAFTAADGLTAQVLDLGLGRPDDFARYGSQIRDRIVLVRHEYPFAPGHVHRRLKLGMAQQHGAAGFLIAHREAGVGPVSGSSGRDGGPGIPALGIDAEAAAVFNAATPGRPSIARMRITGEDYGGQTSVLVLDLPGAGPDWVVVSAHIDGHPHGESAIDNATGLAVALGLTRLFAAGTASLPRGLRICLFSAEEWGLAGSRRWLAGLDDAQRRRMVLNINLDSVGGASRLTALTSGFHRLDAWVKRIAADAKLPLSTHLPLMSNSDHANFAMAKIPALRLLAGFGEPGSNLRFLLTAADTRDKVEAVELAHALRVSAALVWQALCASEDVVCSLGSTQKAW